MVEPLDRSRRAPNLDTSDLTWTATKARAVTFRPGHGLDAFIDNGILQAVRGAKSAPLSNDDVLYVGINEPSAASEVAALKGSGSKVERLELTPRNLDDAKARITFVAALGLSRGASEKVDALLGKLYGSERDIIASLAASWARGERGASIPSRLVLSGHSGSGIALGGGNNYVQLASVQALAAAMPRAAAQIEDVHLSACSTSRNAGAARKDWVAAFPNLKTVWAYNGAAPSPAGHHLAEWSSRTRGRAGALSPSAQAKAGHVAAWSVKNGYVDSGASVTTLRQRASAADGRYTSLVDGSLPVKSPSAQPCEGDYRTYRALAEHPDVSPTERAAYRERADALLRIREYAKVRTAFADAYAEDLERGYGALGQSPPPFATLSRADALREVARFQGRASVLNPVPSEVKELGRTLGRFAALDPYVVREQWCL